MRSFGIVGSPIGGVTILQSHEDRPVPGLILPRVRPTYAASRPGGWPAPGAGCAIPSNRVQSEFCQGLKGFAGSSSTGSFAAPRGCSLRKFSISSFH